MLYKRSVLKNVSKFTDKHKKQSPGGDLSNEKMFLKIQQNSQQIILSGVSLLIKLQTGNQKPTEAATGDALKIFENFTGNNLAGVSLKVHIWCLQLYQNILRHRCFPVKFAIILKNICACLPVNSKISICFRILLIIQERLFCR